VVVKEEEVADKQREDQAAQQQSGGAVLVLVYESLVSSPFSSTFSTRITVTIIMLLGVLTTIGILVYRNKKENNQVEQAPLLPQ